MTVESFDLSAAQAAAALRSGRLTSVQLTQAALSRIAGYDGVLNAFVRINALQAIDAARQADSELAEGRDRGPLHGLPYAVKDLFDVAGEATTCNSHVRTGHVAEADCAVVERMREAGAILLGKLNLHEFATGGTGEGLPHPPARNPWNTARVTGGSSSGCGVAVAARYVRLTIGTDSGGSLRLPGAYCGAVGLKPTFGRVSQRGVFPLSSSLDHCGPLCRSVEDAALVLQAIAGFDPADPLSIDQPVDDYVGGLESGVGGLRIGIPTGHFGLAATFSDSVAAALERTADAFAKAGASVTEVQLPELARFRAAGMAIMLAEAFSQHRETLRTRLSIYTEETADRFMLGAGVTEADLARAHCERQELTRAVETCFDGCDVLLTASTAHGAGLTGSVGGMMATPRRIPLLPFNVTGHPAMHVPTGLDDDGLPVGVQLVACRFGEATLLRAAALVERCSGWADVALPELCVLSEADSKDVA